MKPPGNFGPGKAYCFTSLPSSSPITLSAHLGYTDGVLGPAEFAQFFGVENVWITRHLVEEGGAVRRTWSETDAWFGHVNPARDEPTTARRFRTALPGGPQGVHVRTYFDPRSPMGSDHVVVTRQDSGVVFVGPDFGGLIRGVRQVGP